MIRPSRARSGVLLLHTILLVFSASAVRAEFDESYRFDAESLTVHNLIGEIRVEAASGDEFVVELSAKGEDADPAALDIRDESGRQARLVVGFPLDESRDYVYPEWKKRSSASFSMHRDHPDSWLKRLFGRDKIKVRGAGNRGTELYVDLVIAVPKGRSLEVYHGAGEMHARNVEGDLVLDSHVGGIEVSDLHGNLLADTGSGSIVADGVVGDVNADTGSGSIDLEDVTAETVVADTGSGHIDLADVEARKIHADTGSGRVEIDGVHADLLSVDTGSGSVEADGVSANAMNIDTGSGAVDVTLVEAGDGKFRIDTGSGSIHLEVPEDFSAQVSASTASGGVSVALEDVEVHHRERNEMEFTVGGGAAEVVLDAGSGSIRVASR